MKRQLLYILMLLVLAGAAIGYWLYARRTPDVTQVAPDLTVDASVMAEAFDRNAKSADKQFNGKVVRVQGIIKNVNETGAVVLAAGSSASEVVVGLDERHKADAAQLQKGSRIIVQGVYSGYEQSGSDPADLLAALGTTIHLRSAGVVE